jgi:hypothetical protein
MKTLIALLLIAGTMYGQQTTVTYMNRYLRAQHDNAGVGGVDSSTQILNRTYTAAKLDTTEAIGCLPWVNTYVNLQTKDSASIHIKYQLSIDGVTWGVLTTIDSLSTASNTGAFKSVSMGATILGANYIRFILNTTAFNLGEAEVKPGAHKAVIDKLTAIQERKKKIAQAFIAKMNFRVMLSGDVQKRVEMRKALLRTVITETDSMFSEVSKLGRDFSQVKMNGKP